MAAQRVMLYRLWMTANLAGCMALYGIGCNALMALSDLLLEHAEPGCRKRLTLTLTLEVVVTG